MFLRVFILFVAVVFPLNVSAIYPSWGASSEDDRLKANARIVQRIERKVNPFKAHAKLIINNAEQMLVLRADQDYAALKAVFNPSAGHTKQADIKALFRSGTLSLERSKASPSLLEGRSYKLRAGNDYYHFYLMPVKMFQKLPHIDPRLGHPQRKLRITFFGSCRLKVPLERMRKQGLLELKNTAVHCLFHTASEAMQMYKIATGEIERPVDSMHKYLWKYPERLKHVISDFNTTDAFVVELCTLKEFEVDGIALHYNRLEEYFFSKHYVKSENKIYPLKAYLNYMIHNAERKSGVFDPSKPEKEMKNLKDSLRLLPKGFLSKEEITVLRKLKLRILDQETFIARMKAFSNLVGKPVVFMSHTNVPGRGNRFIFQRDLIERWVEEGAKNLGHPYLMPAVVMKENCSGNVVARFMKDISHYNDDGFQLIGEHLMQSLYKAFS